MDQETLHKAMIMLDTARGMINILFSMKEYEPIKDLAKEIAKVTNDAYILISNENHKK